MDAAHAPPDPAPGRRPALGRARALAAGLGCGPAELAALALLAAGAVAALGVLWIAARPGAPTWNGAAAAAGSAAGGADAADGQAAGGLAVEHDDVIVHVAGRVAAPGLYRLPGGARVGDAVSAAGGPLPDAAVDALNLARVLADGEQLLVPGLQPEPGPGGAVGESPDGAIAGASAKRPDGTLDLNLATEAELQELPGVGPVLAARIVQHRESVGRFQTIGDLRSVPGIGEKRFQQLAPLVSV